MKRRTFVLSGVGAGGALVLAYFLRPVPSRLRTKASIAFDPRARQLNGWVAIAPDDTVTVVMARAEMGQGIQGTLAMLVAEELDCDPAQLRLVDAPIDDIYGNIAAIVDGLPFLPGDDGVIANTTKRMTANLIRKTGEMMTGGSSSLRDLWLPMREAGAHARALLVATAARRWGVAPESCTVEHGVVRSASRALRFGEIVAAGVDPAAQVSVRVKDHTQFTLLGTPQPRIDARDKSSGRARFGVDALPEGLRHAAVVMCPTFGGRVTAFDEVAAKAVAGVSHVVPFDAHYGSQAGVAVIATDWWRAKKGAAALAIRWDAGTGAALDGAGVSRELQTALAEDGGFTYRSTGDVDDALMSAATRLEAEYSAPYLAHATMEPMNCTVRVAADRQSADVWCGTQVPSIAQRAAADLLGIGRGAVRVYQHVLGGGFGRRLEVDFVAVAVQVARAVPGVAVQVLWSREQDMQHAVYRPAAMSKMTGALDANGALTALRARSVGPAPFAAYGARVKVALYRAPFDRTTAEGTWDQPYAIPSLHARHQNVDLPIPVASWRSVGHSHQAFFVESFLDELAHAATIDPLVWRERLLAQSPRALAVVQRAAKEAGWGTPIDASRARGIAYHWSFGSHVAHVVELSIGADRSIRVHRVTCAVDCGFAVNPNVVRQQIESSVVYGLSAALWGEVTIAQGAVQQQNFHQYRLLRFSECPMIDVHIINGSDEPHGIGEPGLPPVAPAVANAVFALTGERLRALPLRPTRIVREGTA
jgi:isoquinoline 1-oxidoreductase subunit beta